MKPFTIFLRVLGLLAFLPPVLTAQSLPNGMTPPIYIDEVKMLDDEGSMHIRIRDEDMTAQDFYAVRQQQLDDRGRIVHRLHLSLQQAHGKRGATPVAEGSDEEKFQLQLLRMGIEHYVPGWTKNWSPEKHQALIRLEKELNARQNARLD